MWRQEATFAQNSIIGTVKALIQYYTPRFAFICTTCNTAGLVIRIGYFEE